jgi:O-Antigen ligase
MPTPLASPHRDGSPPASAARGAAALASRYLALALLVALTLLFVEVLFEAWIQELLGHRTLDAEGVAVGDLPGWPKTLKNGLLLALVALSAAKIAVERRWRDFTTWADIGVVALVVVMAVAGLLGTSGPALIGQAIFVYLRGAIVFYAVRALAPTWTQARRVLWVVGGVIGLNIAVALVQAIVGRPAYSGVGWVDMTWAGLSRAHGLLDHPNHLGHVLGLVLIGVIAALPGLPRVTRRWWFAIVIVSIGIAVTQSRESMFSVLAAAALIWFLRKAGGRRIIAASLVLVGIFAVNQVAHPGNLNELAFRVKGVFYATQTPAGQEDCAGFATAKECTEAGRVESREIRMLFYQQGARLLAHRPVLGYGVGQFGGIVAEQNDPRWELDPRFPGGFNLYDFTGTTVDSFWLHLVIEVGVLGLLAYLAWLWLITAPLVAATPRFAGRRIWGAGGPRAPTDMDERTRSVALWGIGAMLFLVLVGFFSPALEDPLYPPLVFAVFGLAWVLLRDLHHAPVPRRTGGPADGLGSGESQAQEGR